MASSGGSRGGGGGSSSSGGYVDATASAVEYCEAAALQHPEHAAAFEAVARYCRDRLWHQLTLEVLAFCAKNTGAANGPMLLELYDKVASKVATKLNPLSMARIASSVADALAGKEEGGGDGAGSDPIAAKALLENLLEENKSQQAAAAANDSNNNDYLETTNSRALAMVYLQSKHSMLLLSPMILDESKKDPSQLAAVKTIIKTNALLLNDELAANETQDDDDTAIVRAAHYEQAMTYYKIVGPPEAFYEQAMSYLSYAPPEKSSSERNFQLAVDLCLAALTGDGVYHLARVVEQQQALLSLLDDSSTHAWLAQMLRCCANGEVVQLQELAKQCAMQMQTQPALVHRYNAVQEKVTLLALVALVSEKPSHERTLEFSEIASALHVADEQVEWVVMRALAVGLIEGQMDQCDQKVEVTWVMPRILNAQQLSDLATRYGEWAAKVGKASDFMQEHTPTFA